MNAPRTVNNAPAERVGFLTAFTRRMIELTLKHAFMFEWQQRVFNDYSVVRVEFSDYLNQNGQKVLDVGCSTGIASRVIFDMEAPQASSA